MRITVATALVAIGVVGIVAAPAGAETIQFSVLGGQFGNGGVYTSGNSTAKVSFAKSDHLFTYNLTDGQSQNISSFGKFSVTGRGNATINIDSWFKLTLIVWEPEFGWGSQTAEVDGKLKWNDAKKDLEIEFPSTTLNIPVQLPNIAFRFNTVVLSERAGENVRDLGGSATFHAKPAATPSGPSAGAAAPLPGVAIMGLTLMGGLAMRRMRRPG
jgi:hypothetical protein